MILDKLIGLFDRNWLARREEETRRLKDHFPPDQREISQREIFKGFEELGLVDSARAPTDVWLMNQYLLRQVHPLKELDGGIDGYYFKRKSNGRYVLTHAGSAAGDV